ncbi:MAG: 2,3-bisphosphoglycerate-independent phosphoglycerate mutase [Desulfovibrionaceae bacterium]
MAQPIVLLILDGWGISTDKESVIFHAKTPFLKSLEQKTYVAQIRTDGSFVGLPDGYIGNSEVGHITIGSGRIIHQDFIKIENSIKNNSFYENDVLRTLFEKAEQTSKRVHCISLLTDSGVHAHSNHINAFIDMAKKYNVVLYLHLFTDGRDTDITMACSFVERLLQHIGESKNIYIASIAGRYYGMDRDKRWERTEKVYESLFSTKYQRNIHVLDYIREEYKEGRTDEFILPLTFLAEGIIESNDTVFFANFRADRARQLAEAIESREFVHFTRSAVLNGFFCTMTRYNKGSTARILFSREEINNTLGDILEQNGLRQLRIAETEKYGHVTYFFNGGKEHSHKGEDHILVASPRDVATYDEKPQMSAYEVTQILVEKILAASYDVYICNLANLDMVGHTGNVEAMKEALHVVDMCVQKIEEALRSVGGILIVTADHGNIEASTIHSTKINTKHTVNPVYCLIESPEMKYTMRERGSLSDIAPTILFLLGIEKPKDMTGESLLS